MPSTPPERLRVLLIEDNPGDVFLLREMIDHERLSRFQVAHHFEVLAPALEVLESGLADLVLLDLTLPDSDGIETFRRAHLAAPHIPIIVLSGTDDEEMALQTVHLGAQEYLVKGRIDGFLLHRAMRYAIERARSEAELERERGLFHTLFDNIPDRIYFKDEKSRFLRVNKALTRLFGVERAEEIYGKSDADFFGSDQAQATLEDELQVMATGEPMFNKVELESAGPDRKSWVLTTKLPLRDRNGEIIGTCGISREISQLKEMEEQLASERNLLRNVIDNLPDLVYLKDTEGRYLLDNIAHQRWLRASDESEVRGRTVFDFYPDEVARGFHEDDVSILHSGEPLLNREERIIDSNGSERWVLTAKIPWRGEDGTMLGLVCVSRDVTERKQAEEELRQAYFDLARSREEVIAAMEKMQTAHQELHEVQLQLIEAEKMKSIGRLAAGIAHEVKNPLAVLGMGVEFLASQAESSDPAVAATLADMADAVRRADGVIRGLLDFSAPKRLEVRPEDLNAIINRALTLVRGEMKGIEVVREIEPNLPLLNVDSGKIGQVFINLLTNAVHAMPGGGTLTVRTFSKQVTGIGANVGHGGADWLRVGQAVVIAEIDDTGNGIPDDQLSKIFEPFVTSKPTGKGSGLGLSVVKTIVGLHHGTVDVRNLPEGGARATLMFQA